MMGIKDSVLDLLFPRKCVFCGRIIDSGDVCDSCSSKLPTAEGASAVTKGEFFKRCVSPLYYTGDVRESVLRYKFGSRENYAKVYAEYMARCISENLRDEVNVITWVPVSAKRLRKRGYDQSRLIAEELSVLLGIEAVQLLRKTRDNPAQSSLKGEEKRRANVLGAYEVTDKTLVSGKTVLLVDDVITTGATLSECARMLLMADAEDVLCSTLAKGE